MENFKWEMMNLIYNQKGAVQLLCRMGYRGHEENLREQYSGGSVGTEFVEGCTGRDQY